MRRAVVVRGRLSDPTHVELEQPLTDWKGPVEVTLRPLSDVLPASTATLPLADWLVSFDAWVAAHDPSLPVIGTEALRRESLYEER